MSSYNEALRSQGAGAAKASRTVTTSLIDAEVVLGPRCAACDGFMCLDCAENEPHSKCTRACPECLLETADWDNDLEMTHLITELGGLHRLDDALMAFEFEERFGKDEEGRSGA